MNPPSRRSQLIKKLVSIALGSLALGMISLFLFESPLLYGKDQHQMSRLTNNKTFYATEVPLLKPSATLMAMRHTPISEPSMSMVFDSIKAKQLAKIAKENARFKHSRRKCMKWVRMALAKWVGKPLDLSSLPSDPGSRKKKQTMAGRSSEDFIKWALNNPISLCQNLKLANVTEYPDLSSHEGVIHFYAKSSCGFSRRYGHVEVLTNKEKGEACSDHCRTISQPCNPDLILAPVMHCDAIAHDKKKNIETPLKMQKPILMTKYIETRPPAK